LHCPASSGGTDGCDVCARDPADSSLLSHFSLRRTKPVCDPKAQQINPGRSPAHGLARNYDDDGTGATAAIDIRPSDGSSGSGHRHSNKVCIVSVG
jgi:hypothetical protein